MQIRKARRDDFEKIVELQLRNMGNNLSDEEKKDGFLSAYFNAEELAEIERDIGTVVASDNDDVAGFLCVTSADFNRRFSLPGTMLDRLRQSSFDGGPIEEDAICVCGPVCIDSAHRGKGIFESFYDYLPEIVPPEINIAVTLIAQSNGRSLAAHKKVGMSPIDEFVWSERIYIILARPVRKQSG